MRKVCCSLSFSRNLISFRFKMISATSSVTPGTVENSCKMPLMRTATIEAPISEDKHNAPQRIADGLAETALERLGVKFAIGRGQSFLFHLQLFGLDQIRPMLIHCRHSFSQIRTHLEYNSTISFSLIGIVISLRVGKILILPLHVSRSTSAQSGTPRRCGAFHRRHARGRFGGSAL